MSQSLIAFDTNHIQRYVFATDTLKEIRGASSLLDFLNRVEMIRLHRRYGATEIFAHGGSGLFLVATEQADAFGRAVQKEYHERSGGSASISYATQPVPDMPGEKLRSANLQRELNLLQWRLREQKTLPSPTRAAPSHPFMQLCESCGLQYAEQYFDSDNLNEGVDYCCNSCSRKRKEDRKVKGQIDDIVNEHHKTGIKPEGPTLWHRLLRELLDAGYDIRKGTDRPQRTDDFQHFATGGQVERGYLGLIYADANEMGKKIASLQSLNEREALAKAVDTAIYKALAKAIKQHIPDNFNAPHAISGELVPTFGFDVLLIGGDDILLLTHASVAMQVATTLAKEFADWTRRQQAEGQVREALQQSSLSVGVVLAPIKYPFRLLHDLVGDVLHHSKQKRADVKSHPADKQNEAAAKPTSPYSDTFVNFMTVTGNTSQQYMKEFESHLRRKEKDEKTPVFYATVRPYPVTDLEKLLGLIQQGKAGKVGRSKLHELREAILRKNLSTSVVEGLVALRNWEIRKRNFMIREVYPLGWTFGTITPETALTLFSPDHRVIFPWYYAGKDDDRMVYQTPLLDFVELFDFLPEAAR